MEAILWDGFKQIKGELELQESRLSFKLLDFNNTELNFELDYTSIAKVQYFKLYNISTRGIEILSRQGKQNIFMVDHPERLINRIKEKVNAIIK